MSFVQWRTCFSWKRVVVTCLMGAFAPGVFGQEAGIVARLSPSAEPVAVSAFVDPVQGETPTDLIRRALTANGELAAARLAVERARGKLAQAGLRPNPSLSVEYATGQLTNSVGDRATSVGVSVPFELGGKRQRRVDLARIELEAAEADVADRVRRLTGDVLAAYADVLAAVREVQVIDDLTSIDTRTANVVEVRVTEGDTAPLELNLLKVELDRLRARRRLAEGRVQSGMTRLKVLAGLTLDGPLRLRGDIVVPDLPEAPGALEAAIDRALAARPDVKFARLAEEAAQAGVNLTRAQAVPDMSVGARYTTDRRLLPPQATLIPDQSKTLSLTVTVGLPIFNRNQGNKAEAEAIVTQARHRREFAEQVVRAEVMSAFARHEAAVAALSTFRQGVIERSNSNIQAIRAAYEIGAFRVTELLVEQRRLIDSQREFTDVLAERYRALAALHVAVGTSFAP